MIYLKTIFCTTMVATFFLAGSFTVSAQSNEITLSGIILCTDSTMGPLNYVNVYNKNTKKGTSSDGNGQFSIAMNENDTIVFSTIQHTQQVFYFKNKEAFENRNITIAMQMDTIYLKVLDVMGFKQYDEFKREILQLDLPPNDISLATPVIDKYAQQNASGDGAVDLKSPLTHLMKKAHFIKSQNNKKIKFDY